MRRAWRAALTEGQLGGLAGTQLWGRHGWVCYITICTREEQERGPGLERKAKGSPRPAVASQRCPGTERLMPTGSSGATIWHFL